MQKGSILSKIIAYSMSVFSVGFIRATHPPLCLPEGTLVCSGLNTEFVAHCALFIGILLIGTIAVGKILERFFHLPMIAGQILGGIILGPSFFNIKKLSLFAEPLALVDRATGSLYALAASDLFVFFVLLLSAVFTVSYLLWIAGHETDIADIVKVGGAATGAGVLGAVLPILGIALFLRALLPLDYSLVSALGMGMVFAATSVSIPVAMLFGQNKMHLRSSKATLGAAIIDDIVAVILLSVFMIWSQSGGLSIQTVYALGKMLGTIGLFALAGRLIVAPFMQWLDRKNYGHLITPLSVGIMLLYFATSELIGGLAGITGAYFAGLFHRMGDKHHAAEKIISPFVNTILLPLFLGSIGLQVDLTVLGWHDWLIVCCLLVLAIVTKLGATYGATWLANCGVQGNDRWTALEGYLFGSAMVARGEVGLVVATILSGIGVMTLNNYVVCVVVIVLTTIATPIMLSLGFAYQDGHQPEAAGNQEYMVQLGRFDGFGTANMFATIISIIERTERCELTITLSEGRRVAALDQEQVKILLTEDQGIVLTGDQARIRAILALVKRELSSEVGRLA